MRKCRCCLGKARFPQAVGSRASLRKWQQGWSRDDGRGEAKAGGSRPRGGDIYSWRKRGALVVCVCGEGFIVKLCLHPELNESNDLVYCRSPEWTAQGEGGGMGMGGCIIVNSAIYNFFFFFFFFFLFFFSHHALLP